jgi:Transposase DDE domain group 1
MIFLKLEMVGSPTWIRTTINGSKGRCLRLYFSAAAYVLMSAFRRLALAGTAWARAQCETIRLQLLRIAAPVRITLRKVWISIANSYAHWRVFAQAHQQLRC